MAGWREGSALIWRQDQVGGGLCTLEPPGDPSPSQGPPGRCITARWLRASQLLALSLSLPLCAAFWAIFFSRMYVSVFIICHLSVHRKGERDGRRSADRREDSPSSRPTLGVRSHFCPQHLLGVFLQQGLTLCIHCGVCRSQTLEHSPYLRRRSGGRDGTARPPLAPHPPRPSLPGT